MIHNPRLLFFAIADRFGLSVIELTSSTRRSTRAGNRRASPNRASTTVTTETGWNLSGKTKERAHETRWVIGPDGWPVVSYANAIDGRPRAKVRSVGVPSPYKKASLFRNEEIPSTRNTPADRFFGRLSMEHGNGQRPGTSSG